MRLEGERIPAITGIGASYGKRVISNAQIAKHMDIPEAMLMRMIGRTGIESRNWVAPHETTSTLTGESISQALQMAGVNPRDLKNVVVGSSSQDRLAVPVSAQVQHKETLPHHIRYLDMTAACTGWVQAFYDTCTDLTSPLGRGGPQVAVGSEVISRMLHPKVIQTYPLFGDASGATVVELKKPDIGAPTNMGFAFGADGKFAEDLMVPAGGTACPNTPETLEKLENMLHMDNGRAIKEQAVLRMAEATRNALEESDVPMEDVVLFIPHQANREIIYDVADSLGYPTDKVIITLDKNGNTSAATIPTSMKYAYDTGKMRRNDMVAFAVLGAGVTFAAGVIPMIGLPRK